MDPKKLTNREHWDRAWEKVSLPAEIREAKAHPLARELLELYDRYLPHVPGLSMLEIGGAPGPMLAYFARRYGYKVSALDFSSVGCEKIKENFALLHMDVDVYQQDLFEDLSKLPLFDIVYSGGFLEHFGEIEEVIGRHLALLRGNGLLIVGVPNFRGISRLVLRKLAPALLAKHNLAAMDIRNWFRFAQKFELETLFCGYVGGFEPRNFARCEKRTVSNLLLRLPFKAARVLLTDRFRFVRKLNSPYWSAYLVGIFIKKSLYCSPETQTGKACTRI